MVNITKMDKAFDSTSKSKNDLKKKRKKMDKLVIENKYLKLFSLIFLSFCLIRCNYDEKRENICIKNLNFELLKNKIISNDTLFFNELSVNHINLSEYKDVSLGHNLAYVALSNRKPNFVKTLDNCGVDFFEKDSNNIYPICLMFDNPYQLEKMLNKHIDKVNKPVLEQLNTFFYRGNARDYNTLNMLIRCGLDIHDTTTEGACFKLIEYDDIINIKKLKRDINLNFDFYFETGLSPIHYSALFKHTNLIIYFYTIGIDSNVCTRKSYTFNNILIKKGSNAKTILNQQ